jgi:hypothetical protein
MTVDGALTNESRSPRCDVLRVARVGRPREGEEGDLNRGNGRSGVAASVEVGFRPEFDCNMFDDAWLDIEDPSDVAELETWEEGREESQEAREGVRTVPSLPVSRVRQYMIMYILLHSS